MEIKEKEQEIRNVCIPLATSRPQTQKKLIVLTFTVLYIMMALTYLTKGFFTAYPWLEALFIIVLMVISSKIYDVFYVAAMSEYAMDNDSCIVIGFSNKLLLLMGDEVLNEYESDEIKIRAVTHDEEDTLFKNYTSIVECYKNNEIIGRIAVDKLADYEGMTLKADMSRADEDLEIVYDDYDTDIEFKDPDDDSDEI